MKLQERMSVSVTQFNFYGVGARIESPEEEFILSLENDFSYFLAPSPQPCFRIIFENAAPDYDQLPELTCSLATPRNICFGNGPLTYIDYFGRAINIYDKQENVSRIITADIELAHEIAYLTILSRISEALEKQRLHRIHGLGIEVGGRGAIILLPSGGGKSTLALSLLQNENPFRLISEDSPLLRPDGHLLPFPLRLGVHPQSIPLGVDPRYTRLNRRIEFSPKVNIDIRYFDDKICREPVPAAFLLLGSRTTGRKARIEEVPRTAALRHVLANSIIGIGLYQGLEFMVQKSLRESAGQARLLFSRAYNNWVVLKHAHVFQFLIGRDLNNNYECLRSFLLQR
jgi:hypothetical protein